MQKALHKEALGGRGEGGVRYEKRRGQAHKPEFSFQGFLPYESPVLCNASWLHTSACVLLETLHVPIIGVSALP